MNKYDVVYILRNDVDGFELRYSLRSIEKNMEHGAVWFVGGQPKDLIPDDRIAMHQTGDEKWERARSSLIEACKCKDISDKFWLFNDDFFVLEQMTSEEPMFHGMLHDHILHVEHRHGDEPTPYTQQLRECERMLHEAGLSTFNYAIHVPMLIDKQKMHEALMMFPECPMFRSVYGNYAELGGNDHPDVKISGFGAKPSGDFCSTDDDSFRYGMVGADIRAMFPDPCRYEVEYVGQD